MLNRDVYMTHTDGQITNVGSMDYVGANWLIYTYSMGSRCTLLLSKTHRNKLITTGNKRAEYELLSSRPDERVLTCVMVNGRDCVV